MSTDFEAYRSCFPVTQQVTYLNNAAKTPLNTRVRERLDEYLETASHTPHSVVNVRPLVREKLAEMFGGSSGDYALVTSTGVGIGFAASGYPWQPGDNIVVPIDEHRNNTYPWLALRERGVEVRIVPEDTNHRVDPEAIAALVDERTRMIAAASVRFSTGFRADLKTLREIAQRHGALLVIDGIQGAGAVPMDVRAEGIDVLACSGFKWLLGQPGTGFMYASERAQKMIGAVLPGMYAAENDPRELRYLPDARRYETGTISYSLFYAWIAGLELLQEIGIDNVHARVLALTGRLIQGLQSKGIEVISPVEKASERSAIVVFTLGSESANRELVQRLEDNGIIVALRNGRIRVSPNFFNTMDEIDKLLGCL